MKQVRSLFLVILTWSFGGMAQQPGGPEQVGPGEALDLLVAGNSQRAFPGIRDVGARAA